MAKRRKIKSSGKGSPDPNHKEIRGIIFLIIAIVFGVSLLTYYPNDPLVFLKIGTGSKINNLFGTTGAHLAGVLYYILGFGSLWLVAICLLVSLLSFRGETYPAPLRNLIAGVFVIASFSGLLGLKWPHPVTFHGGDVISGGLVGETIAGFMQALLNDFGAYVLLSAIFIISFMICTRLSFKPILSQLSRMAYSLFRHSREWVLKHSEKKRKRRVRAQVVEREKKKPKRKVTIVEPKKEPPKKPEQEQFSFMAPSGRFNLPSLELLNDPPETNWRNIEKNSLEMNARRVEKKLSDFGIKGEVVEILPGPVITMYEFKPAPGVKISKVAGLSDDLAMALRASSVRIVAPIPGKAAIGIEIANNQREHVFLKEVLSSSAFKDSAHKLTIALGKDITGSPVITDLVRMPHLLVAGATGTGKSVSLNAMINSLLFKVSPELVRLIIIDPKRIELSVYKDIPHLMHPVVTEPKEATRVLRWAVQEMERRYMLLSDRGVRNVETYNRKVLKALKDSPKQPDPSEPLNKPLPYIILIIDELADLMMVSSRDVEEAITRLAQMARAAGIHLIIATQRPSVDVLTGIIKANFPTRISFQVSSRVDSRTILDAIGAENLLGEGDMLFMPPGVGRITRIHGAFISDDEVKRVTQFLKEQMAPTYDETLKAEVMRDETLEEEELEQDQKYDEAVDVVTKTGHASISMLQRKLRVGYNRAARMIEMMEKEGIVGPSDGVRPREVFGRQGG